METIPARETQQLRFDQHFQLESSEEENRHAAAEMTLSWEKVFTAYTECTMLISMTTSFPHFLMVHISKHSEARVSSHV